FLSSRNFSNAGTMNFATGGLGYDLYPDNTVTFSNSGTIDFQTDASIGDNGADGNLTMLTNTGTIKKSAGTGTSSLHPAINNTGVISSLSGTLSINGSGNGTSNGTFNVSAGATLGLAYGGTHSIIAGSTVSGAGTIATNGGTVTIDC